MAVLSRVNWQGQQRVDLHHLLAHESYSAFDFRSLVTNFTGEDKAYIVRGFKVVGKTGLAISISVANSLVFNPKDENGSFYVGLPDDIDEVIELPANQTNIYVEARFKNQTGAPVNQGYWDPLALTGESDTGNEFTAAADSQNVIVLEITANTVGFSEGAIPILRASTGASTIVDMEDSRERLYRLAKGGTNPDPLAKYNFSNSREESIPSGTGVADATDSPWRERDSVGAMNDKAFGSFKDWADAVMTRISEVSGSAIWYSSGAAVLPVTGLTLSQLYFDTIGHHVQPSGQNAYKWKRVSSTLRLAGEGSVTLTSGSYHQGLIRWQSNNTGLQWHLGATFASASFRNYSDVRFTSPAPVDGGNIYLLLDREVSKGSGASLNWGANGGAPFVASKSVSGLPGDFTGIALGDYIRKESEGFSRYYKVSKMYDGSTTYSNAVATEENFIADATIIAVELESLIDPTLTNITLSTEPLKYFRSRYSNADIVVDSVANAYAYQTANHYWLGRRVGDLFILRDYGTMQEGEEVTTLDATYAQGNQGGAASLIMEHANNSVYDPSTGYKLKSGAGTLLTIRRYKRDNTIETPTGGSDNSGAMLEYTIAAPVGLMSLGDSLWVRLSDTTSAALTNGPVTNSTDDLGNTDTATNRWEVRSAANTPARTFDDKDVYWIAKRVTTNGAPALLFFDGTILNDFGMLLTDSVHVQGDLKIDQKPLSAALFISDSVLGLVDEDVANYWYDKGNQTLGVFNFRTTPSSIDIDVPTDISFLANLGANTVAFGGASSTVYIPGNLIVDGATISANVGSITTDDKLITLGVGNMLDGGFGAGLEVADNTQTADSVDATMGFIYLDLTYGSGHGYVLGDIIGISSTVDVGGITAGESSGEYTATNVGAAPGDAEIISPNVLRIFTIGSATSTETSTTTPPRSYLKPWSFRLGDAAGDYSDATSWVFRVKNVVNGVTLTPVQDYSVVPTAHGVNMALHRIPFVNNDNAGPGFQDTTLNFSANFTWNNATNTFSVVGTQNLSGNLMPGADDTYDIGSAALQWRFLYLGPGNDSGLVAGGDTNLYRSAANRWKTDDELEIDLVAYFNLHTQYKSYASGIFPTLAAPAGSINVFGRDNLLYQETSDGDVKLLTNPDGNVYEEIVEVVAFPAGNNQMAAIASPPTLVILPLDRRALVGTNLIATTVNGSNNVTISKTAHGLLTGDTVTTANGVAIGGISAANLTVVSTIIVLDANTFRFNAGASATSNASSRLDYITAVKARYYTAGIQELELYLNGVMLERGDDWSEVGTLNALSNSVFINIPIVDGDVLTYRIDSNGGQYIINQAGGTTLQAAYNAGNSLTVATGVPFIINGGAGKLLVINGDVDITGVIDPKGITFTPEISDPLPGGSHGIWFNSASDMIIKRGAFPDINLSNILLSGVSSPNNIASMYNDSGSTLNKAIPVGVNALGELAMIDVTDEPSSFGTIGVMESNTSTGSAGNVVTAGKLENITTGAVFGETVYISKTGTLTNVKPSIGVAGFVALDWIVKVGIIGKNQTTPANKDLIVNIQVVGQL